MISDDSLPEICRLKETNFMELNPSGEPFSCSDNGRCRTADGIQRYVWEVVDTGQLDIQ
jgi:hypothetical protein